jgi:hypothetical protein
MTMNSQTSLEPIAMQPRSTSELLWLALQLYGKYFATFFGLALLVMGPLGLISLLGNAFSGQTAATLQQDLLSGGSSVQIQSVSQGAAALISTCTGLLVLIIAIFYPWMEGAITHNLFERALGRAPSVRESYAATRPRFTALWGSNFLVWLAIYAPLVLLACIGTFVASLAAAGNDSTTPGNALSTGVTIALLCMAIPLLAYLLYAAYCAVSWRFRAPVIIAEGADGTVSLGRSNALTKGSKFNLFGRMLPLWLAEALFIGGPGLVASGLAFASATVQENSTLAFVGSLGFLLISLVAQLLVRPLHIIYVGLLYLDTRIRKENLFVQPTTAAPIQPISVSVSAPAPTPQSTSALAPAPTNVASVISANPSASAPLPPIAGLVGEITPAQKIGVIFNRIRAEGPSGDLLNDLGMAYMDVGDLAGALDALTRARQLAPRDADIAYNLALLHRTRKDADSARSMLREYFLLETNAADADRVRNDPRFRELL